jgi:hypothetical protein
MIESVYVILALLVLVAANSTLGVFNSSLFVLQSSLIFFTLRSSLFTYFLHSSLPYLAP